MLSRAREPVAPAGDGRGSVLMLVPAGVLVLFVLASISVDAAVAFLAQRELSAAAAAAANDAAGAAVSDEAFYEGGGDPSALVLDRAAAERVAWQAIEARAPRGVTDIEGEVLVDGDRVCVTVTGSVAYLFARAVPSAPVSRTVTGRAVATAERGGAGPASRSGAAAGCGP